MTGAGSVICGIEITPDKAQALVARLTRSLVPGGHLFLGHAETLRGLSNDYHLRHTHGTFYYQRKSAQTDGRREGTEDQPNGAGHDKATPHSAFGAAAPPSEPALTTTWLEAIQHASDRIQALTERPTADSVLRDGRGPGGSAHTATQLPLVLELLKKERFSDALDLLGRLPAESDKDTDVLLLRAALLTHSGQLDAAEKVSAQLLERDELNFQGGAAKPPATLLVRTATTSSAAGDPARAPRKLGSCPPVASAPRRTGTEPSGAVRSSWIWNLLIGVFMGRPSGGGGDRPSVPTALLGGLGPYLR